MDLTRVESIVKETLVPLLERCLNGRIWGV